MPARMKDVAALAGVSPAAVSLALRGSSRISPATRARVEEAARELSYQPHVGARSLRTDRTNSLGLVVSDVANPFFAELAGYIQRSAAKTGYSIVLANSDEDPTKQDAYLSSLLAGRQVDGVMLVPVAAMTPGIEAAGAARAKLVLVDRPLVVSAGAPGSEHLLASPVVRSSAAGAVIDAARLLTALGHRRIGIVAPPLEIQIGRERRDLMREALLAHGVAADDIVVVAGDFRLGSGERAVEHLLQGGNRPTALFVADGLMAVGAMKALRRAGIRVPEDISLIGFDDTPWFELLDPPLTTIAQPVADLAEGAVQALLALLDGGPPKNAFPVCQLVVRSSCAPPPTFT